MGSTVQYLENYVENTAQLPAEMQRTLDLIRFLDERVGVLHEYCRAQTQCLIDHPPPGGRTPEQQTACAEAMEGIDQAKGMIYQYIEEKVQLAQRCVDLVAGHQTELDTTLDLLEKELAEQQAAQPEAYNPFEQPYPATTGKRNRGQAYDQWDSLEPMAAQPMKRATSHMGANKGKRIKEESLGGGSYDDGMGVDYGMPVYQEPVGSPLTFRNHAAVADLLDSAPSPQRPGRLLTLADIRPELKWRLAEMFWPDDGMWYVIEIHRVELQEKTATIVYRTGETESLDLQEVAKEGHMSLMDP